MATFYLSLSTKIGAMKKQEILSRRSFLKLSGLTAAGSLIMPWLVHGRTVQPLENNRIIQPDRPFEVDGSIYAWEAHDEGLDSILDNMVTLAGINTVYLVALMHNERRPFTSKQFPHNSVRANWGTEDSCIYFHPQLDLYGRIKPAISSYDWLNSTDWLKMVVDAAHARGLKAGAEISHTPIPSSVLKANPEFQQQDINGAARGRLCPNNPDVREYLLALFGDVAKNYNVDFIQTCMWLYLSSDPQKGTCFCPSCQREAQAAGFDLTAAIPVLKANPGTQPQLDQWLAFKRNTTTKIYQLIANRIHSEKPGLDFRINDTLPFGSSIKANTEAGLHLEDLKGSINSCVIQDHTEQNGQPNETFSLKKTWIVDNRSLLGPDIPLLSGIAVRPKATPDLIQKGIQVAIAGGVNGIACKHYDGATFSMLRAVRNGLSAAGIKGFTPVDGIKAENMTLSGYVADTYLDESCIKTNGYGTAVAKFTQPSGIYDITVSYAGEEGGKGSLSISIAGNEKLKWPLNEEVGGWKRKKIPQITIQTGDEMKLTGVTGVSEGARVDFIEIVPLKSS